MSIHIEWMDIESIQFALSNPKKHDISAMYQSISRYGLVEMPVLNETTQRIVAGHGRIETLREMFRHDPQNPPKNVKLDNGRWLIPVMRGHAFASDTEAQAYLVDSNNIGLLGGELTPYDMLKIWDDTEYKKMLQDLASVSELPVSVDGDDLDSLLQEPAVTDGNSVEDVSLGADEPIHRVIVECESQEQKDTLIARLREEGFLCR